MRISIVYEPKTKNWALYEDGVCYDRYPNRSMAVAARKESEKFYRRSDASLALVANLFKKLESAEAAMDKIQKDVEVFEEFEEQNATEKHFQKCVDRAKKLNARLDAVIAAGSPRRTKTRKKA